ncbi:MAG: redoxin domain-containing protein [Nitrososphaerota archaeon]
MNLKLKEKIHISRTGISAGLFSALFLLFLILFIIGLSIYQELFITPSRTSTISETITNSTSLITTSPTTLISETITRFKASDAFLVSIDGKSFKISDYKGKIIIIDIMSIEVEECKIQHSYFKEILKEYNDKIAIISLDYSKEDNEEKLSAYISQNEIKWTVVYSKNIIASYQDKGGLPTLYIIDKDFNIVYERLGVASVSDLKKIINSLLSE